MVILLVVGVLLVWIGLTSGRYTLPMADSGRLRDDSPRIRARLCTAHIAEAEFWEHRASVARNPETQQIAANLAARHRRRALDLEGGEPDLPPAESAEAV